CLLRYTPLAHPFFSILRTPPLSPHFPFSFFFFNDPPPTEIYTLSLHDALPISPLRGHRSLLGGLRPRHRAAPGHRRATAGSVGRSEEHTSELQSRFDLVCRLLLEKKNKRRGITTIQTSITESISVYHIREEKKE